MDKKIFAFFGFDHKTGTSQMAQCCAEMLADKNPSIDVLLIQADGGRGSEYCNQVSESVERIKPFLAQSVIDKDELKRKALYKDNLFIIGGQEKPEFSDYLSPEMAELLLDISRESFDLVLIDTGSNIDTGFALGALTCADKRFFVARQCESAIRRFEWYSNLYQLANIMPDAFIINNYDRKNLYDKDYIQERLLIDESIIFTVRNAKCGNKTENESKSLLALNAGKGFKSDIEKIVKDIASNAGIQI